MCFTSLLLNVFPSKELVGDQAERPHLHWSMAPPFWKARQHTACQQTNKAWHCAKEDAETQPKKIYHRPLPPWLGTRTLYFGTSFIWDSNYCTNTDYHLKCAAQMDDCLWTAVIVVTYKKSHFPARYSVNPQGSWALDTRSSFWKETTNCNHWIEVEFVPYVPWKQSDSLLLLHSPSPKKEKTEINV